MTQNITIDVNVPLVIDLDGTLILGDSLHESFSHIIFHHPSRIFQAIYSLRFGVAFFKKTVDNDAIIHPKCFVYRQSVIELIRTEKSKGRKIFLVTAATQSIAERVNEHLKCFDGYKGSSELINLKGEVKLHWIKDNFPNGFIYVGDSQADIPIWEEAVLGIAVISRHGNKKILNQSRIDLEVIQDNHGSAFIDFFKASRLHQWTKNLLLFVPLLLGHIVSDFYADIRTLLGFLLFSILASATYIINDISDLSADRLHNTKRFRPIAAGYIPIFYAMGLSFFLLIIAVFGGWILNKQFALFMAIYFILTISYSLFFKRYPLIDVTCIGALFTIRIILGSVLNDLPISTWLLSFSACFFFSLSMAKRHVELMRATKMKLDIVEGRGYVAADWPATLAFGISAAISSIVIMLLYISDDTAKIAYANPHWLYVVPICVFLWVQRIWLLSHRAILDDDPIIFALKDKLSYLLGTIIIGAIIFAL
jgi:4-hydroxybenzoate polyprenyltransferase